MELLDLRGKPCPIPVIEMKRKLDAVPPGESVAALVDNDIARQNLQKMAESRGVGFAYEQTPEGDIKVTLTMNRPDVSADGGEAGTLVVAIGADSMGRGDDELGRMLMKSFIFSLTEQDNPPGHILFFNGGVHLTCAGSAALQDLQALAAKGAVIHSCGACLNFYKKTEELKVGTVTNMFSIVETMARAKRLIQL